MFNDIVSQKNEFPQVVGVIEYKDVRLDMTLRANVYNGYVEAGRGYLVIQPTAQLLGKGDNARWMAIDLDDAAFPINVEELDEVVQVPGLDDTQLMPALFEDGEVQS